MKHSFVTTYMDVLCHVAYILVEDKNSKKKEKIVSLFKNCLIFVMYANYLFFISKPLYYIVSQICLNYRNHFSCGNGLT